MCVYNSGCFVLEFFFFFFVGFACFLLLCFRLYLLLLEIEMISQSDLTERSMFSINAKTNIFPVLTVLLKRTFKTYILFFGRVFKIHFKFANIFPIFFSLKLVLILEKYKIIIHISHQFNQKIYHKC